MTSIQGKTALVTGASSGIGKSTVEMLLSAGAKVYAAARRVEKMKDLEKMGAHTVKMDITDEASIVSGVNSILDKEGSIDILINNAGFGNVILKAVTAKKPKTRYVAGYMARPVLFLRWWLPDRLFDKIIQSMA